MRCKSAFSTLAWAFGYKLSHQDITYAYHFIRVIPALHKTSAIEELSQRFRSSRRLPKRSQRSKRWLRLWRRLELFRNTETHSRPENVSRRETCPNRWLTQVFNKRDSNLLKVQAFKSFPSLPKVTKITFSSNLHHSAPRLLKLILQPEIISIPFYAAWKIQLR